MQTSPWLAALGAIGKSLTFGGEDRTAAKWMLGALPGIKLMKLTAASGHRDTNAAAGGLAQEEPPTPADPSPSSELKMLVFTGDTCFVAVLKIIGPAAEAELLVLFFFFKACFRCLISPLSPQIRLCLHAIMISLSYRGEIRKCDGSD